MVSPPVDWHSDCLIKPVTSLPIEGLRSENSYEKQPNQTLDE